MERKQYVINYHSSGTTLPKADDIKFGEIAVIHDNNNPKLVFKKNNSNLAEIIDKVYVDNSVDSLQTLLEGEIEGLTDSFVSFSGLVIENYATKIDAQNYANIASAKAYSDAEKYINAASGAIVTKIGEVSKNIEDLETTVEGFSGGVIRDYATSANTHNTIEDVRSSASNWAAEAKRDAIASSKTYTDTVSGNAYSTFVSVNNNIDSLDTKIGGFSGGVIRDYATSADTHNTIAANLVEAKKYANSASAKAYSDAKEYIDAASGAIVTELDSLVLKVEANEGNISNLSAGVKSVSGSIVEYVNKKISTVYKFKGSVDTIEDLPVLTSSTVEHGDVYNVVQAFDYDGKHYPAGTNVVAVKLQGQTPYWDALGGTVDLSIYATSADVKTLTDRIDATDSNLTELSGITKNFSASVKTIISKYATSADTHNTIEAAKTSASGWAVVAKEQAIASAKSYTDKQLEVVQTDISHLQTSAGTLATSLNSLSGAVKNAYATSADTHNTIAANLVEAKKYANSASAKAYSDAKSYTNTQVSAIDTKVTNLSAGTLALSADVFSTFTNYATSANTHNTIEAAKTSASGWAVVAKEQAIASAKSYTDATVKDQKDRIDAIETRLIDDEKAISGVSAVTVTAIQGAKLGTVASGDTDSHRTEQSGARLTYTSGGNIVIDLSDLYIDCGTF